MDDEKDLSRKRLSESAPHELEMAFKQALNNSGKIQPLAEEVEKQQAMAQTTEEQGIPDLEAVSGQIIDRQTVDSEGEGRKTNSSVNSSANPDAKPVRSPSDGETKQSLPQSKAMPPSVIDQAAVEHDTAAQANDGDKNYENSFSLFADIFYGVLVAPRQTMLVLGDSKRFAPTAGHIAQAGFLTVLALSATGWLRFKVNLAAETAAGSLFFVLSGLGDWLIISLILFYLSIFMRGHRLSPGNALITVGWCFLPFCFFAPVACFKGLFGQSFLYFATIPAFWFLYLLWTAFQAGLRTSTAKLALLLIAVPPLVVFVYLFWISLSSLLFLVQLSKCLSP